MHSPRRLAIPLLLLGASCTDAAPPAAPDAAPETSAVPAQVRALSLWKRDVLTVCFVPYSTGLPTDLDRVKEREAQQWIEEAITETWERVTKFDFVWLDDCVNPDNTAGTAADITIGRRGDAVGGGESMFGTASLNDYPSMTIGMLCEDVGDKCVEDPGSGGPRPIRPGAYIHGPCRPSPGAPAPAERKLCVQYAATHEFGHALGLLHDHERYDSPAEGWVPDEEVCEDAVRFPIADAYRPIFEYDAWSIMNYCSPNRYKNLDFSDGNIRAITAMYSPQVMTYDSTLFLGQRRVYGPGVHTISHPVGSLIAAPGLVVRVCNASGCDTFTDHAGVDRPNPTRIEISTTVVAYEHAGYQGVSWRRGAGTHLAGTTTFCDNCISSVIAPAGLAVELCDTATSACTPFPVMPDNRVPLFTMPAGTDNTTSKLRITPRVVLYDDADFRGLGESYVVGPRVWDLKSASSVIVPPGHHVKLCAQGLFGPTNCQTFVKSGNITGPLNNWVRYIESWQVAVPPNPN